MNQTPILDDATPNAGRDHHPQQAAGATSGAEPMLAESERLGVIVYHDSSAVALAQRCPEREVSPGRDIQRRDPPLRIQHRTAATDSDAGQMARLQPCAAEHAITQCDEVAEEGRSRPAAASRRGLAAHHLTVRAHQSGRQLGPTDVDGQNDARRGGVSPPKLTLRAGGLRAYVPLHHPRFVY